MFDRMTQLESTVNCVDEDSIAHQVCHQMHRGLVAGVAATHLVPQGNATRTTRRLDRMHVQVIVHASLAMLVQGAPFVPAVTTTTHAVHLVRAAWLAP